MTDQFYRAFEDRYRGSREVIKERLRVYLPFLSILLNKYPSANALDLGCGRGEWLELLGEQGFSARGVDLDSGMLSACAELNLQVSNTDALSALAALPDNSVTLVSAFHLVEHIPFDSVQTLIAEALRVLVPGGLLILETPNAENIVVGSSSFYTDPSHLRPIPPNLLNFATEYAGFERHIVVRLQEDKKLHEDPPLSLLSVLEGASPDYAVIAQKHAEPTMLANFEAVFAQNYGFDMKTLALRYEAQAAARHAEIHQILGNLANRISDDRQSAVTDNQLLSTKLDGAIATSAEANAALARETRTMSDTYNATVASMMALFSTYAEQLNHFNTNVEQRFTHIDTLIEGIRLAQIDTNSRCEAYMRDIQEQASSHHLVTADLSTINARLHLLEELQINTLQSASHIEVRLEQANRRIAEQAEYIAALTQSRSWRITAPLRKLGAEARRIRNFKPAMRANARHSTIETLRRAVHAALRRPTLARIGRGVLARLPNLRTRLHAALDQKPSNAPEVQIQQTVAVASEPFSAAEMPEITARIYCELKEAQQARNKGCAS